MIDLGVKRKTCKILFFKGQFSLGWCCLLQEDTATVYYNFGNVPMFCCLVLHQYYKTLTGLPLPPPPPPPPFCTNKGYYFSLSDFWHFWCVQCVKVKDTDNVLPIEKGLQLPTMMIIIPFKFCRLQAAHS